MEKIELTKRIGIKDIYRCENYTFVYLDNEQKVLVKDNKIYDISEYDSFHKVITMNNIDYAMVIKDNILHLINIETNKFFSKLTCWRTLILTNFESDPLTCPICNNIMLYYNSIYT